MVDLDKLEGMLAGGQDNAMLRFTLGNAYFRDRRHAEAIKHLGRAVELDPEYSAAWKLYGRALLNNGEPDKAARVLRDGLAVARRKGDMQAVREMTVFLKRAEAAAAGGS